MAAQLVYGSFSIEQETLATGGAAIAKSALNDNGRIEKRNIPSRNPAPTVSTCTVSASPPEPASARPSSS